MTGTDNTREPLPTKPDPLLRPWDWRYEVLRSPADDRLRIVTAGAGAPCVGHVKWCRTMLGARFGAWRRNEARREDLGLPFLVGAPVAFVLLVLVIGLIARG